MQVFAAERGMSGGIVRLFNVIGPGETNPHLLPAIVAQLRTSRRPFTWGTPGPNAITSTCWMLPAVSLPPRSAATLTGRCEMVNLGSGQQYSVDDILARMRSVLGLQFEVRQDTAACAPSTARTSAPISRGSARCSAGNRCTCWTRH